MLTLVEETLGFVVRSIFFVVLGLWIMGTTLYVAMRINVDHMRRRVTDEDHTDQSR